MHTICPFSMVRSIPSSATTVSSPMGYSFRSPLTLIKGFATTSSPPLLLFYHYIVSDEKSIEKVL